MHLRDDGEVVATYEPPFTAGSPAHYATVKSGSRALTLRNAANGDALLTSQVTLNSRGNHLLVVYGEEDELHVRLKTISTEALSERTIVHCTNLTQGLVVDCWLFETEPDQHLVGPIGVNLSPGDKGVDTVLNSSVNPPVFVPVATFAGTQNPVNNPLSTGETGGSSGPASHVLGGT